MPGRAFIIVDVQNDFCDGGALAVKDGDMVVPVINKILASFSFDKVVATQDFHPAGHVSFASTHAKNVGDVVRAGDIMQFLWPDHCVAGTSGVDLHSGLDTGRVNMILRKGTDPSLDSYSGFFENDRMTPTGLFHYLQAFGIDEVYLAGLATDYCVYYSAVDAVSLGFKVTVISDAVRGVDVPENNITRALTDMKAQGISFITHDMLPGDSNA